MEILLTFLTTLLLFVWVFISFLPTIIALYKNHTNKISIIIINVFLGFTIIGYFVALIWAIKNEESQSIIQPKNISTELLQLKQLKDSGIITEEEFELQKNKILND